MRAARIILLFFVVLLASAGAAALVNPPGRPPPPGATTTPAQPPGSTAESPVADERPKASAAPDQSGVSEIALRVPGPGAPSRPKPSRLKNGERAVVSVRSSEPGEITIDGLGRIESVTPSAPAIFDLLPDQPGEFEVRFDPAAEGRAREVGLLVLEAPR